MTLNNKSDLSSSLESLRLFNTLVLFVLLTVLSGCSDSGYGEGNLDQEAMDYHKPVSVNANFNTTCALIKSGIVKCWGSGWYGQLGSTSANSKQMFPITVSGITTATSVSIGEFHTCAVLSDGIVMCWGSGDSGQLGNGSTINQATPVIVSGITTATSVSAGGVHSCALLSDGTIKCWGEGKAGKLGNGSTDNQSTPVTVSGITTATSVSTGWFHSCALLSDGTIKCWGEGIYGQLGNGSTDNQSTPVTVSGISTATSVSAGNGHTCAPLSDGTVKCWGAHDYGQLGIGLTTSAKNTPETVKNIRTATSVSAGWLHTCALLSDGSIKCWGESRYGALGNGIVGVNFWAPDSVKGLFD